MRGSKARVPLKVAIIAILICLTFSSATVLNMAAGGVVQAGTQSSPEQPDLATHLLSSADTSDTVPAWATRVGRLLSGSVNVLVSFTTRNSEQLQSFINTENSRPRGERKALTEEQFEAEYSPTLRDYQEVMLFLTTNGITVTQTTPNRLLLMGRGEVTDMERAFNVEIDLYRYHNITLYMNSKEVEVPYLSALGVAGVEIDNRTAEPLLKRSSSLTSMQLYATASSQSIKSNPSPDDLRDAYGTLNAYNNGKDGRGEVIGIVDAFGDGNEHGDCLSTDLDSFCTYYNLEPCYVHVNGPIGGTYGNVFPSDARVETALDVEWAHAIAPAAVIYLQLAEVRSPLDLSPVSMMSAFNALVSQTPKPNVISVSWGWPEVSSDKDLSASFQAAAAMGIDVYVASGDDGAYGKYTNSHGTDTSLCVSYPASDPYVIAVGGTTLYCDDATGAYSEVGWSHSGGGYSTVFPEPAYQSSAGIADPTRMRAVPDIALDADPGVLVFYAGNSLPQTVGGTSLSAPLMGGIDAVALQGYNLHLNDPNLYCAYYPDSPYYNQVFNDTRTGNNDFLNLGRGYSAGLGWDAVTGLGSIYFQSLVSFASASPPSVSITSPYNGQVFYTTLTFYGRPTGVGYVTVYVSASSSYSPYQSVIVRIAYGQTPAGPPYYWSSYKATYNSAEGYYYYTFQLATTGAMKYYFQAFATNICGAQSTYTPIIYIWLIKPPPIL